MRKSEVVRGLVCAGLLLLLAAPGRADQVTPVSDVKASVAVRLAPSAQSALVGQLKPGEKAELVGTVPNWHKVRLADGTLGFVSKRWTRVLPDGPPGPQPQPQPTATSYTVDVADVGTGLAVVVQGKDFLLVYDGGSNDDDALGEKNRLVAFLKKAAPGRTTIDQLILSHPHKDHVELLPDLFASYTVREVWDSGRVNPICAYRALLEDVSKAQGVKYHNALQDGGTRAVPFAEMSCYGKKWPAAQVQLNLSSRISETPVALGTGATMTILHADGSDKGSPNTNSLVTRLDLCGTRVLLMGDAEAGGRADPSNAPAASSIEGQLLACCAADVAARVMVVGHHGSMTSSRLKFLDAVGASFFLVSAGPTKYGSVTLPDAAVIQQLQKRGQVFRTDANDAACGTRADKIGPTSDGQPGGCDNFRVTVGGDGTVAVAPWP